MTGRRGLAVFLVVDVACAAFWLAVLAAGGLSLFRVAGLLLAVGSALDAAAGLARRGGRR